MRAVCLFVLAGCAGTAAPEGPVSPEPELSAPPTPTPTSLAAPLLAAPLGKHEGHLDRPICVGQSTLKPPRPRKASCCYPAREAIVRPLRKAFPALRTCFDARQKRDAEGRVVLVFRVEQDGSILRVCTGDTTTMDDAGAARCMVETIRRDVRYPAMSDEETDFCGLLSLTYPVVFER